jgi:hypothetical protein
VGAVSSHLLEFELRCCFTSDNAGAYEEKAKYAAPQMGFGFGR